MGQLSEFYSLTGSVYISVSIKEDHVSGCVGTDELVITGYKSAAVSILELIEISVAV